MHYLDYLSYNINLIFLHIFISKHSLLTNESDLGSLFTVFCILCINVPQKRIYVVKISNSTYHMVVVQVL